MITLQSFFLEYLHSLFLGKILRRRKFKPRYTDEKIGVFRHCKEKTGARKEYIDKRKAGN